MTTELVHYSATPLVLDRARIYDQADFGNGKPRGLWVTIDGDDGWAEWCRAENFATENLAHRTTFTLAPDSNVRTISTHDELLRFSDEYGADLYAGSAYGVRWIDWARVAEHYDGILIAPYQWKTRLDLLWYYGWDVASACIWNLDALHQLEAATA